MIELRDIGKSYRMGEIHISALSGVSLSVKQGELIAIMGPSGSGKSTLMNVLGCLDRPTNGTYLFEDREISSLSDDELAHVRNAKNGFVFQSFNLLPRFSALKNVEMPLIYSGIPAKGRTERAIESAQRALTLIPGEQDAAIALMRLLREGKPLPPPIQPRGATAPLRMAQVKEFISADERVPGTEAQEAPADAVDPEVAGQRQARTILAGMLFDEVKRAVEMGFHVGIVANAYWANSVADALEWLAPLAGLIDDLSVSSDLYHYSEAMSQQTQQAVTAAGQLGIPVGNISVAQTEAVAAAASGQLPQGQSGVMYRGRAASKLASRTPHQDWETFTLCPHEDLRDPGRTHLDPLGNLHICQGISLGNLFTVPLDEIIAHYDPESHPICGPLFK